MGLGVEEDLRMPDLLLPGPGQVRPREFVEITIGDQHLETFVIEVEEVLEVAEPVGGPEFGFRAIADPHAIARGHLQQHFGFERPLDMQVKLGLG